MPEQTGIFCGLHEIIQERFEFAGLHGAPSCCGIEIYFIYKQLGPRIVIIATELPDNPGTSVTNAWPELADKIILPLGIPPEYLNRVVWIERYLPRRTRCAGLRAETFDRVFLELNDDLHSSPGLMRLAQGRHPWQSCTREQVECLIERPVHPYPGGDHAQGPAENAAGHSAAPGSDAIDPAA